MVAGTVIAVAGAIGVIYAAGLPHLDDHYDERYLTIETAQQTIQALTKSIEEERTKSERDYLANRIELILLEEKFLASVPESERTARDQARLSFLRDQRRVLQDRLQIIQNQ